MRFLALVVMLALPLSGCLHGGSESCTSSEPDTIEFIPNAVAQPGDPEEAWQGLAWHAADPVVRQAGKDVPLELADPPAGTDVMRFSGHNEPGFYHVTVDTAMPETRLLLEATGSCPFVTGATLRLDPMQGTAVYPGQAAMVHTAGFLANGTLFYTNIQEVHDMAVPRVPWYAYGGDAPLPVYVYDESPSEQGILWHASTYYYTAVLGAVIDGQAPGSPLDGAFEDAPGVTVWDYFPTIAGFNEALKWLTTTGQRVADIAPEDAYTQPGREDHVLYGERLIFVIYTSDVETAPCIQDTVPADACLPDGLADSVGLP